MPRAQKWTLGILGFLLVAIILWAVVLGDLREKTVVFEYLFFSAFILYGIACFLILGIEGIVDYRFILGILVVAVLMQAILIFTRPTLSDDMYRYVWDTSPRDQPISLSSAGSRISLPAR